MSNVGQIALDVVGLVATIYTGNPIFLTAAIAAGNVLFPTQLPSGPRLTDHRTTTASIGDPIAITFGTSTVAGTVMWLAPSLESKKGGKGGPNQTTYSYTQSIAIGLCEAVIDGDQAIGGLTRIWENGEIVYDIRPQLQANTYTGAIAETDTEYANRLTQSAVYAATFTLYLGTETQDADPTIEALEGFGNVPAWRGQAYIVYPNRVLQTAQGWRHPNFQFEIYQSGTGTCTTETLYSNEVLYPWIVDSADPTNVNNKNTFHISQTDPSAPTFINYGNENSYPTLDAAIADANTSQGISMTEPIVYRTFSATGGGEDATMRGGNAPGPNIITFGSGDISFVDVYYSFAGVNNFYNTSDRPLPNYATGTFWYAGNVCVALGPVVSGGTPPLIPAGYLTLSVGNPYGTTPFWYAERSATCLQITRSPAAPLNPCAGLPPADGLSGYAVQPDGSFVECENWTYTNGYFLTLGSYVSSNNTPNPCQYPQNPCVPLADSESYNEAFWTNAYNAAVAAHQLPAGYSYVAGGGDTEANVYPKLQDFAYTIDRRTCVGIGAQASVGDIIEKICARAGVDSIDTDDLNEVYIGGYTINNLTTGASIISPLRSIAFFDAVESGEVLRFQTRGGNPVATLTTDDIGAFDGGKGQVPPSVSTTRTLDIDLPKRIRLHYSSTSRDYQDAEQDSPFRLTTTAINTTDVSLPLSLGDTQALQSAEIIWADSWAGRTAHTVAVDQSFAYLEPGDAILIPVDNVLYRTRIISYKVASGVLMTLSLVRDDDTSYFSTAIAEPPKYVPPTLSFLAQTLVEFLDLPALQDADSDAGFYIAAQRQPGGGNWGGCTIYQSSDGGATYSTLTTITTEATLGHITSPLAASDWHTWDDASILYVIVSSASFTFESMTDESVIAGGNAAAMGADGRWEIIQFANAELVAGTTWKLTRLLRGRRGTEHNIGSSQAGDVFVIVSTGDLARVVQNTSQIGSMKSYLAVTNEAAYSTGVMSSFAGHGMALEPFSPVDVKSALSGSDLQISWTRRDRLGRTLMSGVDMPLSDPPLAFQVDIVPNSMPTAPVLRTLSTSLTSVTYAHGYMLDDLGNPLPATFGVRVYQMSPTIGRGIPALAVLSVTGGDGSIGGSDSSGDGGGISSDSNRSESPNYIYYARNSYGTDTPDVSGFELEWRFRFPGSPGFVLDVPSQGANGTNALRTGLNQLSRYDDGYSSYSARINLNLLAWIDSDPAQSEYIYAAIAYGGNEEDETGPAIVDKIATADLSIVATGTYGIQGDPTRITQLGNLLYLDCPNNGTMNVLNCADLSTASTYEQGAGSAGQIHFLMRRPSGQLWGITQTAAQLDAHEFALTQLNTTTLAPIVSNVIFTTSDSPAPGVMVDGVIVGNYLWAYFIHEGTGLDNQVRKFALADGSLAFTYSQSNGGSYSVFHYISGDGDLVAVGRQTINVIDTTTDTVIS